MMYLILKSQITLIFIVVTVRCGVLLEFLGCQRFLDVGIYVGYGDLTIFQIRTYYVK